jgi:hypothetical protein
MALTQVNQAPQDGPKKSKLEYFSQGLDIAQSVAGIANSFGSLGNAAGKAGGASNLMGQGGKTSLEKYHLLKMKKDPFNVGNL